MRERRAAVGKTVESPRTPEQEVASFNEAMRAAQAAGDISTILHLIAKTAELTPDDFVTKTVGYALFLYYFYLDSFHCTPKDMEDLIDGLLYIESKRYIEKRALADAEALKKDS